MTSRDDAGAKPVPLVTLGLPVYNGEAYLGEAMAALLSQTFSDFEIIVSDNASTDGTEAICRHFAGMDSRVRYYRADVNRGAAWNFNHVLELANGKYFKWAAHDDLVAPDYLERVVAVLESDPGVVVAHTGVMVIGADGEPLFEYDVRIASDAVQTHRRFADLVLAWSLCFEVFGLIRTDVLKAAGGMGGYGHADGVLLARLGLRGRFYQIDDRLFMARQHPRQSQRIYGKENGGNDYHSYTEWFAPQSAGKLVCPMWRITYELYMSIWRTPDVTFGDRIRCHYVILRFMRQRARGLLGDLAYAARWFARAALPGRTRSHAAR